MTGVTGAYLLQADYGKPNLPTEAAVGLQQFTATGIPQAQKLNADTCGKVIAASEVGIGAALVTPSCPTAWPGWPWARSPPGCCRSISARRR